MNDDGAVNQVDARNRNPGEEEVNEGDAEERLMAQNNPNGAGETFEGIVRQIVIRLFNHPENRADAYRLIEINEENELHRDAFLNGLGKGKNICIIHSFIHSIELIQLIQIMITKIMQHGL